ncbi:MAG: hypothetical protein ACJ780_04415 [Solirubrobacteraceae bacterium]
MHQGDAGAASGHGHLPAPDPAEREHARLLQCWRGSEQRVLRTWHAWLAAGARDKPERYGAYLRALADEERAAAAVEVAARMLASQDPGGALTERAPR